MNDEKLLLQFLLKKTHFLLWFRKKFQSFNYIFNKILSTNFEGHICIFKNSHCDFKTRGFTRTSAIFFDERIKNNKLGTYDLAYDFYHIWTQFLNHLLENTKVKVGNERSFWKWIGPLELRAIVCTRLDYFDAKISETDFQEIVNDDFGLSLS